MRSLVLAAAAASLFLAGPPVEAAGLRGAQAVRGPLVPTDETSDAHGKFRMLVQQRGEAHREYFYVDAWGLDATRDDQGELPVYHVFLTNADGTSVVDFGQAWLTARGRAKLRFHSARDTFPEGVTTLADYGGGTVEIRLGDAVILTGEVPEFVGVADENEPGSGAAARAAASVRLVATDEGGRARGFLTAAVANRPVASLESVSVTCLKLGEKGESFDVVCSDSLGVETTLGSITVRTRARIGVLLLSTRRGDTIPGGGVLALAGQTVEVRDADGVVHLTGTFPDLAGE
jgi:hypothetical protein